jgi:hypothetical protein
MDKVFRKEIEQQPKRMESLRAGEISFAGEQDGPVENELKSRLLGCFQQHTGINAAYLVRVRYGGEPKINVALCLAAGDKVRPELVEAVGLEFRKMFNSNQSLDVLFLSPEQQQIATAAKPFYRRSAA